MKDIFSPAYKVVIVGSDSQSVEMHQFLSLQFAYSLNRGSIAQLTMSMDDPKLTPYTTAVLQSWIKVYRRDNPMNNASEYKLVWYGKMYNRSYSGDQNSGQVTFFFKDLASLLETRFTAKGYQKLTPTDASDILWEVINNTQLETYGSLGITRGAHPTSHNRTAGKDLQSRNILDILVSYSEINYGIDWEITPTPYSQEIGIFNTFYRGDTYQYHKGAELSTSLCYRKGDFNVLHYNNISTFDIEEKGEEFANRVAVYGAATTETQLTGTSEDLISQASYGLFEAHPSESDVSVQDTLDDKSATYLAEYRQIPKSIKLKQRPLVQPRFGTFDVGDIFNFKFMYAVAFSFEAQYRLYQLTVNVGKDGTETMDLTLNVV